MILPRPTIVLFDMDGTTVRHVNPWILGLLEFIDDTSYKCRRLLRTQKETVAELDAPNKKPRLLVHRALHKIRRKPVDQIVQPCPGIYTLLNLFKDNDIPMGVVSNGLGKGYGDDILKKFMLEPYFQTQIFREDITRSKPNPEPLLRALRDIKEPLSEKDIIWYIGDRHKDVTAALAADQSCPAKVIPLAYGLNASVAILEKGLGPEYIIMDYHDFADRAQTILKKKPKKLDNREKFSEPLDDNDPLAV